MLLIISCFILKGIEFFFNEIICKSFTEIRKEYLDNLVKYNTAQNLSQDGKFSYELMKEIQVSMQKKIPKIRGELENDIRGIISVIEKSINQETE